MSEHDNTQIVQGAYAAFGRGDVQGILNLLADDVDWEGVIGAAPYVPTAGRRRGKAAVAEFFSTLAATTSFQKFEPREFVAQGDKVVALGHYALTALSTGRSTASDWAMVFTIQNGKMTHFREFTDSAAINAVFATPAVT